MKALTNLRFGREPEKEAEEQRVVQLFRNRAELKKAYASLQDEMVAGVAEQRQRRGAVGPVAGGQHDERLRHREPERIGFFF